MNSSLMQKHSHPTTPADKNRSLNQVWRNGGARYVSTNGSLNVDTSRTMARGSTSSEVQRLLNNHRFKSPQAIKRIDQMLIVSQGNSKQLKKVDGPFTVSRTLAAPL